MKQIKPGRGISQLGYQGSLFAIAFGVLWTIIAAAIGIFAFAQAGGIFAFVGIIFPLFGILFIAMAVKQAKFQKHNATAKDRHSIVDIVDATEEGDPFAKFDRAETERKAAEAAVAADAYCTRCGTPLEAEDNFCPKCGNPVK